MKLLHFTFKNNDKIIIDKEVSYIDKGKKRIFSIDKTIYTYDIEKELLIKKDNEKEIIIAIKKQNIDIFLPEIDAHFDMPIKIQKYDNCPDNMKLIYSLEDAEKTTNIIIIKWGII